MASSRRIALRALALGYLGAILIAPVALVFWRTFAHGIGPVWAAFSAPDAVHALRLTLEIAAIAVPLNAAFGILCALAVVRGRFPGAGLVNALVDLPLALSPVVVGLALFLLYGSRGWLGGALLDHGVRVLFAVPGMVLATMFVSLPFVVREVVPVLREIGTEQEQVAATLGASPLQTFRRVTLPSIGAAVGYGAVLTTARSLGEFGAVSVVSGRIVGKTETLPIRVQDAYDSFDTSGAYTGSVTLAALALLALLAARVVRRKGDPGGDRVA